MRRASGRKKERYRNDEPAHAVSLAMLQRAKLHNLFPTKLRGVTATIAIAWATILPTPSATSTRSRPRFAASATRRDCGEAHALVREVPPVAAEGPVAVPPVVVRDGDEEREERRAEVVQPGPLEQRRVDREVDRITACADDAELRELNPVVRRAERPVDRLHYAASSETTSSVPSASTVTRVEHRHEVAQRLRAGAVEVELILREQHERRLDDDLPRRRRPRRSAAGTGATRRGRERRSRARGCARDRRSRRRDGRSRCRSCAREAASSSPARRLVTRESFSAQPARKPRSPLGSSSSTLMSSTRAPAGPRRHHATSASTASGAPSNTASTVPLSLLRTQPETLRERARAAVE